MNQDIFWTSIGTCAALMTMFAFVPQIIKVAKTRCAHDLSLATILQMSAGVALWLFYGLYRRDPIIIGANGFTLVTLLVLLGQYIKYRKKK